MFVNSESIKVCHEYISHKQMLLLRHTEGVSCFSCCRYLTLTCVSCTGQSTWKITVWAPKNMSSTKSCRGCLLHANTSTSKKSMKSVILSSNTETQEVVAFKVMGSGRLFKVHHTKDAFLHRQLNVLYATFR